MAKKEELTKQLEKTQPKVINQPKSSEHHEGFFPKGRLILAFLLIFLGAIDYLRFNIVIPKLAVNIVLILTGIYLIIIAFGSASARRRRALMKRYI